MAFDMNSKYFCIPCSEFCIGSVSFIVMDNAQLKCNSKWLHPSFCVDTSNDVIMNDPSWPKSIVGSTTGRLPFGYNMPMYRMWQRQPRQTAGQLAFSIFITKYIRILIYSTDYVSLRFLFSSRNIYVYEYITPITKNSSMLNYTFKKWGNRIFSLC